MTNPAEYTCMGLSSWIAPWSLQPHLNFQQKRILSLYLRYDEYASSATLKEIIPRVLWQDFLDSSDWFCEKATIFEH